jgi:hypothetical protein
MSDLLAQFRKKPVEHAIVTLPPDEATGYVAFHARDRVERLKIRRANAPARAPGYAYLLDVISETPYGTRFALLFTFMVVTVRGKNLLPIVLALESGTAEFIQEFDGDHCQQPKDKSAPFIESIEVVVKEHGPNISDTEAMGQAKSKASVH